MRVTSIQLDARNESKADALKRVLALLDDAAGSDLVLLPELWPTGYFAFERYADDAEPIDGTLVQALAERARALKCWLFGGSIVERDGANLYNTSILFNSDGQLAATYRKVHLFGYGSEEQKRLCRGTGPVVAETPWGPAGLATCYDLRFPELFRAMTDRGAKMFLVASAWPAARTEAWRLFNRARAHENLAYLFSCNGAGASEGRELAGHSSLIGPLGETLAEGGRDAQLVSAEVDPAAVDAARTEFPALADRVLTADATHARQAMLKEHLEFFAPDLETGWSTPAGYPAGIQEKLLAGALDEARGTGCRTRLLRFAPGAFTTEPFEHTYWEEVFLVRGTLEVSGEVFPPCTYAVRPPHTPHGPFKSADGCLLFEIHYFATGDNRLNGEARA